MLFHARYSTPTDAVSRKVATNEPSIFDVEPLQITRLRRKYASWLRTKSAAERM